MAQTFCDGAEAKLGARAAAGSWSGGAAVCDGGCCWGGTMLGPLGVGAEGGGGGGAMLEELGLAESR